MCVSIQIEQVKQEKHIWDPTIAIKWSKIYLPTTLNIAHVVNPGINAFYREDIGITGLMPLLLVRTKYFLIIRVQVNEIWLYENWIKQKIIS